LTLMFFTLKATEQEPDLLIYKTDTIFIDKFPLDLLAEKDYTIAKRLADSTCISTDCLRQYIAIWKIQNDSLFLVGLKNCCNNKTIQLDRIFEEKVIKNNMIFAFWYTDRINSEFGKYLRFSEDEWKSKFDHQIELVIDNGQITKLTIKETRL
jgi:hypothetical protein